VQKVQSSSSGHSNDDIDDSMNLKGFSGFHEV
jgi:hypothetical protein